MSRSESVSRIAFLPARLLGAGLCSLAVLSTGNLWAQSTLAPAVSPPATLTQAFAAAWARQPEAQSLDMRRDAAEARRQVADSWTAQPPSLELAGKTDQLSKNQGSREYAAGVTLPLWLPGERSRLGALADAESKALDSRVTAAQLRTAAAVRDAWWNWQRARGERLLARERLVSAQRLAEDVRRRVKAGDLARSDQHQADGAAASAEVALAESGRLLAAATQQLRALIGALPEEKAADGPETPPAVPADFTALDATHPAVVELFDRAEVARRSADLASVQTRNNPELLLATTRERGAFGDDYQQTVTLGVRIFFGSETRNRAKFGLARAEALETEGQLRLERERLAADLETARVRVESTRTQLAAAEKRFQLARESRGFFDKSFRLGESDLPTRLRIELEAVEAERESARIRIDLAAAISALRQAMGLLPEQK
jgi:cobalt-zinc-cadmium efflux system outer membrane protein